MDARDLDMLGMNLAEVGTDLISRAEAIDVIFSEPLYKSGLKKRDADEVVPAIYEKIKSLPSAQSMRKKGKWTEKHHAYSDEESVIEEWQSCCCSECGRYDTRPYMYYFSTPNYCSYCGADMRCDDGL